MSALPGRIAVVHEWLIDYAGSERVLAEILRCFPQADLFALVDRMPEDERSPLGGRRARTSFLQSMPGITRHLKYYLPLMPFAIEQLDVTGYDLVISSSHTVAKGVITSPDALHLSYVHSPMRFAWDLQFAYLDGEGATQGVRSIPARWLLHWLRQWDRRSAAGVDHFAANSAFVARRMLKAWRREATVIHPPVDIESFAPAGPRGAHYVTAGRLMPYKRVDLIVEAFRAMPQRRLIVVGDGPQMPRLRRIAPPNVQLLGTQPAAAMRGHLAGARAFVFAAVEDFGIAPLEAQACGTPVIALRRGGAAETIAGLDAPAPTGVFYEEQSAAAIAAAIEQFEKEGARVSAEACRTNAMRFAAPRFREQFMGFVEEKLAEWRAPR